MQDEVKNYVLGLTVTFEKPTYIDVGQSWVASDPDSVNTNRLKCKSDFNHPV